jgi:hypothetical protein
LHDLRGRARAPDEKIAVFQNRRFYPRETVKIRDLFGGFIDFFVIFLIVGQNIMHAGDTLDFRFHNKTN